MEQRVYAYDSAGDYLGYLRVSHDEIGNMIGEVYNKEADKLGAVQYTPLESGDKEALVFDPEGIRIGSVQVEGEGQADASARLFFTSTMSGGTGLIAVVNPASEDAPAVTQAEGTQEKPSLEVRQGEYPGAVIGALKPENLEGDEAVLFAGAAALLLIL